MAGAVCIAEVEELVEVGPAHTKGDVFVHVPSSRVVFSGDILFAGSHPIMWQGPVENWIRACDRLLALDVDVSAVLAMGAHYEVRNGQNYLAAPVTSGTYMGGTLTLPMTAGLDPALPIGPGKIEDSERTGKAFNVFVLLAGAGPAVDVQFQVVALA